MTIFVHRDEFEEKEQDVIAGIHRAVEPDFLELESDLALIAVVGRGMRATGELPDVYLQHLHMQMSMSR